MKKRCRFDPRRSRGPLVAAFATALIACGTGTYLPVSATASTAPRLTGAISYGWTPDNNGCVADVHAALVSLPTHGRELAIDVADLPSFGRLVDHAQGIARLPGDTATIVISRSGGGLGAVVARVTGGNGEPLMLERTGIDDGEIIGVIPSPPGADHGGGIQLLGNLLAIPYEKRGTRAVVGLYDLSDPRAPRLLYELDRTTGTFPYPANASNAALAKLADGRLLLIVGAHSSRSLDFYVSNGDAPGTPGFEMRFFVSLKRMTNTAFQNTSLLTQCDGTLFLVGAWNTRVLPPSGGADKIAWVRLSNGADGLPEFSEMGSAHLDCGRCNFAAGAAPFVTADGNIALYAVSHSAEDGTLAVEEFHSTLPPSRVARDGH